MCTSRCVLAGQGDGPPSLAGSTTVHPAGTGRILSPHSHPVMALPCFLSRQPCMLTSPCVQTWLHSSVIVMGKPSMWKQQPQKWHSVSHGHGRWGVFSSLLEGSTAGLGGVRKARRSHF